MKNYWNVALCASLVFHAAIIVGVPPFQRDHTRSSKKETYREISMVPQRIEKIPEEQLKTFPEAQPLPYVENIMDTLLADSSVSPLEKPSFLVQSMKEVIFSEVSPEDADDVKKNPAYMGYYRLIREKIRATMYRNYSGTRRGEVALSFCVSRDGTLQGVAFGSHSVSGATLKDTALKSLKESAPFPEFPPELHEYSRLQFNLSVYFKN
jgi:outer membrane biosynthesis protein TonB